MFDPELVASARALLLHSGAMVDPVGVARTDEYRTAVNVFCARNDLEPMEWPELAREAREMEQLYQLHRAEVSEAMQRATDAILADAGAEPPLFARMSGPAVDGDPRAVWLTPSECDALRRESGEIILEWTTGTGTEWSLYRTMSGWMGVRQDAPDLLERHDPFGGAS